MTNTVEWAVRPEIDQDRAAVRSVLEQAFRTTEEADLVDALRENSAWLEGLSYVAEDQDGTVVAHALLTRCHIGDVPALCLAPCSVLPEQQRGGAGTAVTTAMLHAAAERGEKFVVVLGHPEYYPRFGFERASSSGVHLSIEVPDEALMVLSLDGTTPVPSGLVRYAKPFGI